MIGARYIYTVISRINRGSDISVYFVCDLFITYFLPVMFPNQAERSIGDLRAFSSPTRSAFLVMVEAVLTWVILHTYIHHDICFLYNLLIPRPNYFDPSTFLLCPDTQSGASEKLIRMETSIMRHHHSFRF